MNEYPKETIWLAALLHDLGKFRQRAEPTATATHQEYGRRFVETDFAEYFAVLNPQLGEAIANHHAEVSSNRIQKLVKMADRLSMHEGSTETATTVNPPWEPLSAMLTCQPIAPTSETRQRVLLQELKLQGEETFPIALGPDTPAAYTELWNKFTSEFKKFVTGRVFAPADVTTILSLLHKYTSCMPAPTETYHGATGTSRLSLDTSLFLHLKTTAAIAACLHDELSAEADLDTMLSDDASIQERKICALVKGDISGTQDFIYLLTSSGAARGLRARSFYLQFLTETIASWILRQVGLPETNLLFAGGGHFYVLLPHTRTMNMIDTWRKRISEKLWRGHRGDLYLNIGYAAVTYADLLEDPSSKENGFSYKWSEVTQEVSLHKQKKWLELGHDRMHKLLFSPQERGGSEDELCAVCRFEGKIETPEENKPRKCERCRAFEKLGKELRDPAYMVTFFRDDKDISTLKNLTWHDVLAAFGTEMIIGLPSKEEMVDGSNATVWKFDSTDFLSTQDWQPHSWNIAPRRFSFRLLAGATPAKPNDNQEYFPADDIVVAEFSDLAKASTGAKWLGVLRMDVDNLGEIFRTRLGTSANLARMSTLSETLRLFFESRVPQLCRKRNLFSQNGDEHDDKLFLLYAGGDDLFVVGAWSELPTLAKEIHGEFQKFINGNHLTLSAGIAIEHDKYPLYQLANDGKQALDDHAKNYERPPDGHPKDAICFLQSTLGWEAFPKLEYWQQELVQMIEAKPALPRGFLTRLGQIYSLFAENRKSKLRLSHGSDLQNLQDMIYYEKWRWHLTYQLGRLAERYPEHQTKIETLQKQLIDEKLINNLNVIARWAELSTRKE